MKKILLIVGLAFGCGSVYAQNIISQIGNNNTIDPDQSGVLNPATKFKITQRNDWNNLKITQGGTNTGIGNYAELTQIAPATPIGFMTAALANNITVVQNGVSNKIFGTQIGFKNGAYLRQGNSTSLGTITTEQYGSRNALGIYQDAGTGNVATVKQGTSYMPSTTPPAYFDGNDPMLQRNNSTELRQTGEAGQATITQSGSFGYIKAFQSGGAVAANTINIAQSNNGGVELDQAGNNNKMTATQRGFQIATLEQGATSKNGDISIVQGNAPMDQTKNDVKLRQLSGDGNKILVYQDRVNSERNTTRITQSNDGNTATSTQEGKSSMVIATQSGAGNTAMFLQKNAAFTLGSTVTSTQTGDGGLVDIIQDGNLHIATFTQAGTGNEILADQIGLQNTATVDQLSGSGMKAKIAQKEEPSGPNSQKNTATITQAGTDVAGAISVITPGYTDFSDPYNPVFVDPVTAVGPGTSSQLTAEIRQGGREGIGTIDQKGTSNNARVRQLAPYSFQSKGVITQAGVQNNATIDQFGKKQDADVTQAANVTKGTINVTQGTVFQFTPAVLANPDFYTTDNKAIVKQLAGDQGTIVLNQDNSRNMATLTQESGNKNNIKVQQNPNSGVAQPGSTTFGNGTTAKGNTATITQKGGDNNNAKLSQKGDETSATGLSYDNELTLTQDGNRNILGRTDPTGTVLTDAATQTGKGNRAILTQTGNDLFLGLDQAGTNGKANSTQTGTENQTGIYQFSGDNNQATVTQGGGGVALGNTIGIAQEGDNNTATVLSQTGTENEAYIGQSRDGDVAGVGNTTTVTQAGMRNGLVSAQGLSGNKNTVDQAGMDNLAATVQYGQGNTATTNQAVGTSQNTAVVLQGQFDITNPSVRNAIGTSIGGGAAGIATDIFNNLGVFGTIVTPANGNTATVNQTAGNNDNAIIVQVDDNNIALANQTGLRSDAAIVQVGDANRGNVNTQGGEDNETYIIQDRDGDEAFGLGNTANVSQLGKRNQILTAQGESANTSTTTQAGDDNFALTGQYGRTNDAAITQAAGTTNGTAAILQGNFDLTDPSVAGAVVAALGSPVGATAEVILDNLNTPGVFGGVGAAVQRVVGNKATVNQTAGAGQIGLIGQVGDNNEAQLDQSGTGNAGLLLQGGKLKDKATVTQTGTTGIVILGQQGKQIMAAGTLGNTSTITQAGTNNAMLVGQSGTENSALIDQKGTDNGIVGGVLSGGIAVGQFGVKNQVTVNQNTTTSAVIIGQGNLVGALTLTLADLEPGGGLAPVKQNVAKVDQVGTQNVTLIGQMGNEGDVKVDQAGMQNNTFVTQLNPATSPVEVPLLDPISFKNKADVTQMAAVTGSTVSVNQVGRENETTVKQIKGTTLIATVDQAENGNNARNNMATVTQDGTDVAGAPTVTPPSVDYSNPYSPVVIPGTSVPGAVTSAQLTAIVTQEGREGIVDVNQKGTSNTANVKQYAPYSFQSKAYVTQEGKGSGVVVDQFGGRQYAKVDQAAAVENSTIVVAQGIGSLFNPAVPSNPEAFTNDNQAFVKQLAGTNNSITLSQNNERNMATLTQQSGNNNAIAVNQYPQDPADVQPGVPTPPTTGFGNNSQLGNTVMITQKTGNGNVAKLDQFGYDNELTLTQDGTNNTLRKSAGVGNEFALQQGHGNRATLSQTGMGHTINLQQGGVSNTANVTQTN